MWLEVCCLTMGGFGNATHNPIAIAYDRLNLPGQIALCVFHLGLFATLAFALLEAKLSSYHSLLILSPTQVSMQESISEHCHLDEVPSIPEGTDCLLVGRKLHIKAVDLDGGWTHYTFRAGESSQR